MKIKDISIKCSVNRNTVSQTMQKWMANGGRFPVRGPQYNKGEVLLSHEEMSFILDRQTLINWSHYSLNVRTDLIFEKYDKKISRHTLSRYYWNNGIRKLAIQKTIANNTHTDAELN